MPSQSNSDFFSRSFNTITSTPDDVATALIRARTLPRGVNAPDSLQRIDEENGIVREYDYGGDHQIVVDFGEGYGNATIDVVDGTAIVVVGTGEDEEQFEVDLPTDASDVSANNGILTITA